MALPTKSTPPSTTPTQSAPSTTDSSGGDSMAAIQDCMDYIHKNLSPDQITQLCDMLDQEAESSSEDTTEGGEGSEMPGDTGAPSTTKPKGFSMDSMNE